MLETRQRVRWGSNRAMDRGERDRVIDNETTEKRKESETQMKRDREE